MAYPPLLGFTYGQASTGIIYPLILGGRSILMPNVGGLGDLGPNADPMNIQHIPLRTWIILQDSTSGGSATCIFKTSPDGSTWTAFGTAFTLTIASGLLQAVHKSVHQVNALWFGLDVTAVSGGVAPTIYGVARVGSTAE